MSAENAGVCARRIRNSPSSVTRGNGQNDVKGPSVPFRESSATPHCAQDPPEKYVPGAVNLSFALMKFSFGNISNENLIVTSLLCGGSSCIFMRTRKLPFLELAALMQEGGCPASPGKAEPRIRVRTQETDKVARNRIWNYLPQTLVLSSTFKIVRWTRTTNAPTEDAESRPG